MDLRVVLGFVFVVVTQARNLTLNDRGTCEDVRIVQDMDTKAFPLAKYKHCPKGYNPCKNTEKRKLPNFSSKVSRCCTRTVGTKRQVKEVICCPDWKFDVNEGSCIPQCRMGCENGWCDAPKQCKCYPPFALHDNKCIPPVCEPTCGPHATCDNDTCKCESNYDAYNSTHCIPRCEVGYINDPVTFNCIPKCDNECVNGSCTEPNKCTCNNGFMKKNDFMCIPECTPSCVNAECVAPDVCLCFEGYKSENNTNCSPVCDVCVNGDCVAPNYCKCHDGYLKINDICTPICEHACNNGVCSGPNVCKCDSGYDSDPKNKYNCRPICESKCVNASCVSPNVCSCFTGYEYAGNNWTCKPKCDSCEHGECVAPNDCRCDKGFSKNNNKSIGKCGPICTRLCVNAECTAPELCTCKEGYRKNEVHPFECIKPCKGICNNGMCVDGECECFSGYQLSNETCIPMTPVDCSICVSNCSANQDCWCQDGRPCSYSGVETEVASSTGLASLEATWMLCGAVALLLLVLTTVVLQRLYRKRKQYEAKAPESNTCGSVVYTTADTLMQRNHHDLIDEEPSDNRDDLDDLENYAKEIDNRLLNPGITICDNV